eukprot:TRINITY_DN10625_c0_g1_i1.p1 TRINITY_DN10625_c0_g1~~TRINITY_DN10625_c0_g1_i1.p1  ORF type:complete len:261 (+),score=64.12 TRINITY_DN10625_c0_g1_i1:52-834(+)
MRRLFFITGASRGFGKCIAIEAAQKFDSIDFVLSARTADALRETEKSIHSVRESSHVVSVPIDLSHDATVEKQSVEYFSKMDWSNYDQVMFFMNAAVLGPLRPISDLTASEIQQTISVNVSNSFAMVSSFVRHFHSNNTTLSSAVIVNTSSLAALKAFPCWSAYCTAKAATDMLMKCVAEEAAKKQNSVLKTLSYAPGPLDTDMQAEIRESCGDEETRSFFVSMKQEGKLVQPIDSARKLLEILDGNKYASADHVDFFDS